MDSQTPGPSGLNRRHRNIFEAIDNDMSDENNDFDILHESDESVSSSDEEVDRDVDLDLDEDWRLVTPDNERDRLPSVPSFTVRNSMAPKNIPEGTENPIDFFLLYFGNDILNSIVTHTNMYADSFLSQPAIIQWVADHPSSRYTKWPEGGLTLQDLKSYLGLILNMGLNKDKPLSDYWSTKKSQHIPFFRSVMPYNKFVLISRMLHVADHTLERERGHAEYDPWAKIRPILTHVNNTFKAYYTPSQHISIDESMVGMKNRCVFIQYMPNKRHSRFGIKKFELCDSNGYTFHLQLYAGKELDVQHVEGQAFAVVEKLMRESNLLGRGYHLFTDNFYTKPKLAEFLFRNKTLLSGTVRSNSKGLPSDCSIKLPVAQAKFWRKNEQLAVAFREKKSQTKNVLLLSTGHNAQMATKQIKNKEVTKPTVIFSYNSYMGGVDLSDKKVYHLASERSTRHY